MLISHFAFRKRKRSLPWVRKALKRRICITKYPIYLLLPTTVLTDRFKGSGFNLLNNYVPLQNMKFVVSIAPDDGFVNKISLLVIYISRFSRHTQYRMKQFCTANSVQTLCSFQKTELRRLLWLLTFSPFHALNHLAVVYLPYSQNLMVMV